ncbi:ribonuclease H-like domain-containing protein [Tanacetum coccineum]
MLNCFDQWGLFKHKFNADGSLSRYKARLVANGRSQQQGIDCDETFSPVVKPDTIRTVLSLAVTRTLASFISMDVKNAFFHGSYLDNYMHQPPGISDRSLDCFGLSRSGLVHADPRDPHFTAVEAYFALCCLRVLCVFLGDPFYLGLPNDKLQCLVLVLRHIYRGVAKVLLETAVDSKFVLELHTPLSMLLSIVILSVLGGGVLMDGALRGDGNGVDRCDIERERDRVKFITSVRFVCEELVGGYELTLVAIRDEWLDRLAPTFEKDITLGGVEMILIRGMSEINN